jgi:glycosyltransferase involved in cell wall biosynthesis
METPINLLYFASDYSIGLSNTLSEQARSINQLNNFKLTCIAGEQEQEEGLNAKYDKLHIKLIRVPGLDTHKNFFLLTKAITEVVKKYDISVVHIHNNWQLAMISYIKFISKPNLKVLYSLHGYRHNHKLRSLLARPMIGLALRIFTNLVFAGSTHLRSAIPFIKSKCKLLVQGVEEDLYSFDPPQLPGHHKNLIFAAQFRVGKNHIKLIQALGSYITQTNNRDITLFLPGEGPLKQMCIDLVLDEKLQDIIKFPGQLKRNQILDLYRQCQLAVIPSNNETFGYCIAEPFVAGLCVISRKTGIAVDVIRNGVTGIHFNDKHDLIKIFQNLLQDDITINKVGTNAFKERDSFRWNEINKGYKLYVENIFEKKYPDQDRLL